MGSSQSLSGKAALITGAARRLGRASALAFARAGADVAITFRTSPREAAQTVRELTRFGGRAVAIECDVTEETSVRAAVQDVMNEFGRLDILVNNAGVMLLGPIEDAPLDEWERMVHLNVLGLLYTAHAALPHLLKAAEDSPRKVADLINVSSVAGRMPRRGSGVYNLTKFGVGAFSESLRQEVTTRHVRVALVEPGAVATELTSHMRPEIQEQSRQRFASIERLESEDIADAIVYIVTRSRRVAINELLIRPTEQEQ